MQALLYYSIYPFMWLISLLPFSLLYAISDVLAVLVYYVFPYRKKVVLANLTHAFPEKTKKEILSMARLFYIHFCDVLMETIKTLSISEKELTSRVRFINMDIFDTLYKKNRSVVVAMGHYGNWEWYNLAGKYIPHKAFTIYKPLTNMYYDRLMKRVRGRFGILPIPMGTIYQTLVRCREAGILTATGFIADQAMQRKDIQYWTTFLHQETPVLLGLERIAKKTHAAVAFFTMRKIRRGYYEVTCEKLFDDPSLTADYEITEAHVRKLEQLIREHPQYWLWTHRRWKHKRNPNNA